MQYVSELFLCALLFISQLSFVPEPKHCLYLCNQIFCSIQPYLVSFGFFFLNQIKLWGIWNIKYGYVYSLFEYTKNANLTSLTIIESNWFTWHFTQKGSVSSAVGIACLWKCYQNLEELVFQRDGDEIKDHLWVATDFPGCFGISS